MRKELKCTHQDSQAMEKYRTLLVVIAVVAVVSLYFYSRDSYRSYSEAQRQIPTIPYPTIDATKVTAPEEQPQSPANSPSGATAAVLPTRVALPPEPTATPHPLEFRDFANASWLQRNDPRLYDIVSELAWVSDGISEAESEPMQELIELGIDDPAMTTMFLETPWFTDAISEEEAWTFTSLVYLSYEAPDIADDITSRPWFADGINDDESWAVISIADIAYESREAAGHLVSRSWVTDGISKDESWVISALGAISYETGSAGRFVSMSFLDSFEPSDSTALISLNALRYESPESFDKLLSHPAVADGITDDETVSLTLAADVYEMDPELAGMLLDSSEVLTETRDIDLPLAGMVRLVIVRAQPGSDKSMDHLEDAVRFTESYMDEALPRNLVLLLYADAVQSGFAGHNSGTNMVVHPDYDTDGGDYDIYDRMILTHEVAHYYWRGSSESWLDEGAAEMISVSHAASDMGIDVTGIFDTVLAGTFYCPYTDNLSGLEELPQQQAEDCAYSLGPLFFFDLYSALGPEDFRRGFRELYLQGKDAVEPGDPNARRLEHVKEAFKFRSEEIGAVIEEWYAPSE